MSNSTPPPASIAASGPIAYHFVGSVVPDRPEFRTVAFSRAGNTSQDRLLAATARAGIDLTEISSVLPAPAWPNGPLVVRGSNCTVAGGIACRCVSFLNIVGVKHLTTGLGIALRILRWGGKYSSQPRIVSTFNLSFPPGLFTWAAARLAGAKLVAHLFDINVPGQTVPNSAARRADYWLQRWVMKRCDALVVVSSDILKDFRLDQPSVLVDGGIEADPNSAAPGPLPDGVFVLAYTGGLTELNGVRMVLGAFSQLRGEHYRLIVAGAGPLASEVAAAAGRDPRIDFRGLVSAEDVASIQSSANLLLNPRLTAAMNTRYFFPSKMIEYMATGRPVASTCTGHVESEFGDFVFLLRNETPEALADLVRHVEQDQHGARSAAEAARRYVLANKTWSAQGRKVADLLRALAA